MVGNVLGKKWNWEISMFSFHSPNNWVHSNSSRTPQVLSYESKPLTAIQIYHIYAADLGLHQIKFIINPVHSQILCSLNRNIQNFLDI